MWNARFHAVGVAFFFNLDSLNFFSHERVNFHALSSICRRSKICSAALLHAMKQFRFFCCRAHACSIYDSKNFQTGLSKPGYGLCCGSTHFCTLQREPSREKLIVFFRREKEPSRLCHIFFRISQRRCYRLVVPVRLSLSCVVVVAFDY